MRGFTTKGIIAVLIMTGMAISAQNKTTETTSPQEGKESSEKLYQLNVGNYLEKYHQTLVAENLKSKNLYDIHLLSIIIGNFGGEVQGTKEELDSIKKEYQIALRYYYRRAYMVAGPKMKDIERKINDMYKKFSQSYEAKTDTMLTDCADAIVTMEQNESLEPGSERYSKHREIAQNQIRLKIAYYQMGQAERMAREGRYSETINHYRLAKEYAITILSDVKATPDEKKAVVQKYQADLADNKNMIFKSGKDQPSNTSSSNPQPK